MAEAILENLDKLMFHIEDICNLGELLCEWQSMCTPNLKKASRKSKKGSKKSKKGSNRTPVDMADVLVKCELRRLDVEKLREQWANRKIVVGLMGSPNSGKSYVSNSLLTAENKAIFRHETRVGKGVTKVPVRSRYNGLYKITKVFVDAKLYKDRCAEMKIDKDERVLAEINGHEGLEETEYENLEDFTLALDCDCAGTMPRPELLYLIAEGPFEQLRQYKLEVIDLPGFKLETKDDAHMPMLMAPVVKQLDVLVLLITDREVTTADIRAAFECGAFASSHPPRIVAMFNGKGKVPTNIEESAETLRRQTQFAIEAMFNVLSSTSQDNNMPEIVNEEHEVPCYNVDSVIELAQNARGVVFIDNPPLPNRGEDLSCINCLAKIAEEQRIECANLRITAICKQTDNVITTLRAALSEFTMNIKQNKAAAKGLANYLRTNQKATRLSVEIAEKRLRDGKAELLQQVDRLIRKDKKAMLSQTDAEGLLKQVCQSMLTVVEDLFETIIEDTQLLLESDEVKKKHPFIANLLLDLLSGEQEQTYAKAIKICKELKISNAGRLTAKQFEKLYTSNCKRFTKALTRNLQRLKFTTVADIEIEKEVSNEMIAKQAKVLTRITTTNNKLKRRNESTREEGDRCPLTIDAPYARLVPTTNVENLAVPGNTAATSFPLSKSSRLDRDVEWEAEIQETLKDEETTIIESSFAEGDKLVVSAGKTAIAALQKTARDALSEPNSNVSPIFVPTKRRRGSEIPSLYVTESHAKPVTVVALVEPAEFDEYHDYFITQQKVKAGNTLLLVKLPQNRFGCGRARNTALSLAKHWKLDFIRMLDDDIDDFEEWCESRQYMRQSSLPRSLLYAQKLMNDFKYTVRDNTEDGLSMNNTKEQLSKYLEGKGMRSSGKTKGDIYKRLEGYRAFIASCTTISSEFIIDLGCGSVEEVPLKGLLNNWKEYRVVKKLLMSDTFRNKCCQNTAFFISFLKQHKCPDDVLEEIQRMNAKAGHLCLVSVHNKSSRIAITNMNELRSQRYSSYTISTVLYTAVLMNLSGLGSINYVSKERFFAPETTIADFNAMMACSKDKDCVTPSFIDARSRGYVCEDSALVDQLFLRGKYGFMLRSARLSCQKWKTSFTAISETLDAKEEDNNRCDESDESEEDLGDVPPNRTVQMAETSAAGEKRAAKLYRNIPPDCDESEEDHGDVPPVQMAETSAAGEKRETKRRRIA